jgi:hypothetical protein
MQVLAYSSSDGGSYSDASLNEYDPVTGLYYESVETVTESSGFISKSTSIQVTNIVIFNPETEKHTLLFKDGKIRYINYVTYETGIDNGIVEYRANWHVKNNTSITSRPPKDKLLVEVIIEKSQEQFIELWTSDKRGNDLKLLTTFPNSSHWHIDARNSKIRIISYENEKFSQKSIEW